MVFFTRVELESFSVVALYWSWKWPYLTSSAAILNKWMFSLEKEKHSVEMSAAFPSFLQQ